MKESLIIFDNIQNSFRFLSEESIDPVLTPVANQSYEGESDGSHALWKMIFLLFFVVTNFIFGIVPSLYTTKKSIKTLKHALAYLNTFGAAIGIGSAFFLVLPRASEIIEEYFEKNNGEEKYGHLVVGISWATVSTFSAYTLMLIFQKILFAPSTGGHGHGHGGNSESLLDSRTKEENDRIEDENEEAFKNVVSTRGRFGTFMGLRNLKKSINSKDGSSMKIRRTSVIKASLILSKSMAKPQGLKSLAKNDDMDLLVNPMNVDIGEDKRKSLNEGHSHSHNENSLIDESNNNNQSPLMAYLLLAAISFHGLFQGFTIGVLESDKEIVAISLCFLITKSIESLSIGQILKLAGLNAFSLLSMILMLTSFVPLGILVGTFITINGITRGLFMGVCCGVMLYQSVSENIVQEFTFTKNRYSKFFTFISGVLIVALVACLIEIKSE